jgi:DNA repair ATPase RecN
MAITKLNDLLDQNDSTQASSYLYEANTGIAIDYTPYLSRIAASLETISSSLNNGSTPIGTILSEMSQSAETLASASQTLVSLASTTGIKTVPAYGWLLAASMYKISVDDTGAIGLTALTDYHTKLNDIAKF